MMNIIKKIFRNESGFILPTALVLLILGGLLVVPSLYLLQTSLKAGQVVDIKTKAIYAADAGIEDALWKYKKGTDPFAGGSPPYYAYMLQDGVGSPAVINGMTVTVEKWGEQAYGTGTLYTVKSVAKLNGQEKAVITAAPLVGGDLDLSWMFDHAITSAGDVTIKPGVEVVGGIIYDDDGTLTNQGEIEGEILQEQIDWPTCVQLSTYYLAQVDGLIVYPSSSISTSGWTLANPKPIGPLYRVGALEINGGGYSRLDGTIYVDGDFNVQPNCTVDLNGKTIFATGELNFQPNSIVYGPGCIIACSDVNFQPNMAPGNKLLGVDDTESLVSSTSSDTFLLARFQAGTSGSMTNFHVRCSDPDRVKLAVYADSGGAPGAKLGAADTPDQAVVPGWNTLNFPATSITNNSYYWLAAISDNSTIGVGTLSSTNNKRYKTALYSSFTFPNPAGSGFTIENNASQYLFAGWSGDQEFIFVMSVSGTTTIKPGGTFYGCVAGDSEVYLAPHCSLTLVGVPEGGLDFPGVSTGGGGGDGDFTVQLLTYSVQ